MHCTVEQKSCLLSITCGKKLLYNGFIFVTIYKRYIHCNLTFTFELNGATFTVCLEFFFLFLFFHYANVQ